MIAVFDSGLGGLSVLREMLSDFADQSVTYCADRQNAPYGSRSLEEVRQLTYENARTLVDAGATTVVLACNTASAAALSSLRDSMPDTRFVGMEPAVKPAAQATKSGVVGVLATAATFQGELFGSLIDQYASDITVLTRAAPKWVALVESGKTKGDGVDGQVREDVGRLVDSGADTLVLGCTHFSFLTPTIRRIVGESVTVIDPAPAVAKQARLVHPQGSSTGGLNAMVSGDREEFRDLANRLSGIEFPGGVLPL